MQHKGTVKQFSSDEIKFRPLLLATDFILLMIMWSVVMGNLGPLLKKYCSNDAGNFALLGAVVLPSLAFAVAAALDISSIVNAENQNQNALDNAVLSAVMSKNDDQAKRKLRQHYVANGGKGKLVNVMFAEVDGERRLMAKSSYQHKNVFPSFLGRSSGIEVASASVMAPALEGLYIRPISAGGTFSKRMTLHSVNNVTGNERKLGEIEYVYNSLSSGSSGDITSSHDPDELIPIIGDKSIFSDWSSIRKSPNLLKV